MVTLGSEGTRTTIVPLAIVLALLVPAAARANPIAVTTTHDVVANDSECSLREAIDAAFADAAANGCAGGSGADTITLGPGHFLIEIPGNSDNVNATGDFDVRSDVTIEGAGAPSTTIDATGKDRVFDVRPGGDLTLRGLTMTGGHAADGANALPGTGGFGGSGQPGGCIQTISGSNDLTVVDSAIVGNTAGNGGAGGSKTGDDGSAGGPGNVGTGGPGGQGGSGGGIRAAGPVTLTNTTVSANTAGDGGAGGVGLGGSGDTGTGSNAGGAGGLGVGGDGGSGGFGGGVLVDDTLTETIEDSTISGNSAGQGGSGADAVGGLGGNGGPTGGTGGAGGDAHSGNGGAGGSGGGVTVSFGHTPIIVTRTTVAGNSAGDGGAGGLAVGNSGGGGGSSGNGAGGSGGAGGDGSSGQGGAGGMGGGIHKPSNSTLGVTSATISGNTAGAGGSGGGGAGGSGGAGTGNATGGNGGDGTAGPAGFAGDGGGAMVFGNGIGSTIVNATFSGDAAGGGGAGGDGTGGDGGSGGPGGGNGGNGGNGDASSGIFGGNGGAVNVTLGVGSPSILHSTVASSAAGSGGFGGAGAGGAGGPGPGAGNDGTAGTPTGGSGAAGGSGGNLFVTTGTLENSIVVSGIPNNCAGNVTDSGNNVSFPDASCGGTSTDPKLGPLADNGGPTKTRALGLGSSAVDLVPTSGSDCEAADQRNVSRPRGAGCDAGAYERAAPAATTGDPSAITPTGATVAGSVTPNGPITSYRFDFGTTTAYGSQTPSAAVGPGLSAVPVTASIGGLAPGTIYHYRVVAVSADGTATAADKQLTTLPDTTPPLFLSAVADPPKFAIDPAGPAETLVTARAQKGTTFRYSLSEAARVVFTIERSVRGRKVRGKCRKQTKSNRAKKRCKRFTRVGRFAHQSTAGANTKRFSGRIGSKKLKRGRYRATLVATDAAGNASKLKQLRFKVVKK